MVTDKAYIHTYIHTYIHAYIQHAKKLTLVTDKTYMYTYTYIHTYIHTYIQHAKKLTLVTDKTGGHRILSHWTPKIVDFVATNA